MSEARAPRTLLRCNGQSLVEFAAAIPVLLLICTIALDFSRVFYTYTSVTSAAREGARYAARYPFDTAEIKGRAAAEPAGTVALVVERDIVVGMDDPEAPTTVWVTVSYAVSPFTPMVRAVWNGQVSATVEMPVLGGG